jgi:hypothetical protein
MFLHFIISSSPPTSRRISLAIEEYAPEKPERFVVSARHESGQADSIQF